MRTLFVAGFLCASAALSAEHQTRNIIFVMTDGLRWQEVFGGADSSLIQAKEAAELKAYSTREGLMPFLWSTIAKNGQIYGNQTLGSEAYVTNGHNFSYPGYNETLCGFPDPRVDSNDKKLNPNVTVFEWLNQKPAYKGKVAAFGAWDTFPFIFNAARAGFPVNAGYDPFVISPMTPKLELLNALKAESPHVWEDEAFDAIPFQTALEYLKVKQPRLLYLSLGEPDDWAHAGNYAEYLRSIHRADEYLKTLWETAQSMPGYRGHTTLIFSPDHGRGGAPVEWKSHGEKIPASKYIWMAFLGADTKALGERSHIPAITQSQIAATLAALLGEDYNASVPQAGKPIIDVLPR
jgi:Sulfatase